MQKEMVMWERRWQAFLFPFIWLRMKFHGAGGGGVWEVKRSQGVNLHRDLLISKGKLLSLSCSRKASLRHQQHWGLGAPRSPRLGGGLTGWWGAGGWRAVTLVSRPDRPEGSCCADSTGFRALGTRTWSRAATEEVSVQTVSYGYGEGRTWETPQHNHSH